MPILLVSVYYTMDNNVCDSYLWISPAMSDNIVTGSRKKYHLGQRFEIGLELPCQRASQKLCFEFM